MKTIAITVVAVILLVGTESSAQTKLVAHRSHGGSIATFVVDGADDFGNPPPYPPKEEYQEHLGVTRVVWLNDSSALQFSRFGQDTTVHHPYWNNPEIGVDSLRKIFPDISFEGYTETGNTSELREPADRDRVGRGMLQLTILTGSVTLALAGGILASRKRGGTS